MQSVSSPTASVVKTVRGAGQRARMGGDKTPDSQAPKRRGRQANTRVRTLKDMLNTMPDKKRPAKKEKTGGYKKRLKASEEDSAREDMTTPIPDNSLDSIESKDSSETDESRRDGCFVATKLTVTSTKYFKGKEPSMRWGHTLCRADEKAILIGGQGDKQTFSKDSIWVLDIDTGSWSVPHTTTDGTTTKPETRMGHTAVYDPTVRSIYLYGGSKNLKWYSDVHILDTDEWKWQVVKANGKAPTRAYHSSTLYRHELWIFGGVYPRPDPQPDGCSNDVHVFSPIEESWYSPIVMGEKPSVRSGHSATLLSDQLVVFGGWDAPVPYNDLYVLDLCTVEWSKPEIKGTPPSPRSWHASCALAGNRVAIHGGYNGNNALMDLFIFNLDELMWTEVQLNPPLSARAGHAALCLLYTHEQQEQDKVLLFGGGDNEGEFFNDLVSVMVPFETKNVL